jgi:hypothetical protein
MKDPNSFDDRWDHYAFEEARDAVAGNPTPQSAGGPSHYVFCEGVIDSHLSYDMPFRECGYIATQQPKRSIPDYLTRRVPNDSEDDLISIDPDLLDFDRMTEQPLLDDFTFYPALLSNLSWPMDLQAPCYFFANYVLENSSDSQGYLEYLPKLCQNDVSNSFLMDAVTSLGLAGLAVRRHDSSALNFSRLKYSSALNQLNIALTSTENALTDQALITVFLLGLYEVIASSIPDLIVRLLTFFHKRSTHVRLLRTFKHGRSMLAAQ